MEVPDDDWLCRFVTADLWDYEDEEPLPLAFQASDRALSVWHEQRVLDMGESLNDLCIESLKGAGHAILTTRDYVEAAEATTSTMNPRVYFRPDGAAPEWQQWSSAHANVETTQGKATFPQAYRLELVKRCERLRSPATRSEPPA